PARVQYLISRNIRYAEDRMEDDHWATPLATLLRGSGDCEDHVLLKQAILTAAGLDVSQTRLLILETSKGRGHMVLQVLGPQPTILDNRYRYPVTLDHLRQDTITALATDHAYFVVN
ncbi:MAG: transglutaminase-like cysteine peptidase, partial [Roseibium sp.]|uniref:transglutaminase-like cysteine peptidase n=1 Tax=Roseibium sp. TaxID=1936156 RepID=UPI00262C597D